MRENTCWPRVRHNAAETFSPTPKLLATTNVENQTNYSLCLALWKITFVVRRIMKISAKYLILIWDIKAKQKQKIKQFRLISYLDLVHSFYVTTYIYLQNAKYVRGDMLAVSTVWVARKAYETMLHVLPKIILKWSIKTATTSID